MRICFIVGSSPSFLGGISLFQNNLINYLRSKKIDLEITWIYQGKENRRYSRDNVKYIEIGVSLPFPLGEIVFNKKLAKFLEKNHYDIINSHATWGFWLKNYKKVREQKTIHTFHGSTYYFFKNHLDRFSLIKKLFMVPLLLFSFFIELPPSKSSDKIICVSEHVKKEIVKLYGKRKGIDVIRTGVNLKEFNKKNKKKLLKKLNLDREKSYGLYVGRGGFWTKGLDRVIKLSEELYNLDKNYRLIVIGSDKSKVDHLLNRKFIIFLPHIDRGDMSLYYGISDIFFCLSRYEGGAPTLTVSEAMASGCLVVCSRDSRQEIIVNEKNGIIVKENYKEESKRILSLLKDKKKLNEVLKNSLKKVKELSLERWGERYLGVLLK